MQCQLHALIHLLCRNRMQSIRHRKNSKKYRPGDFCSSCLSRNETSSFTFFLLCCVYFLLMCTRHTSAADLVTPEPYNLTIVQTSAHSVQLTWKLTPTSVDLTRVTLRVIYQPVNTGYRVQVRLTAGSTLVLLANLCPATQYRLIMTSQLDQSASLSSPVIFFHTSPLFMSGVPMSSYGAPGDQQVSSVEEILIVVVVLGVWCMAIGLFFNRWGKIRLLEPYEYNFKYHYPVPEPQHNCSLGERTISPMLHSSFENSMNQERQALARCSSLSNYFTQTAPASRPAPEVKVDLSEMCPGRPLASCGHSRSAMTLMRDSAV